MKQYEYYAQTQFNPTDFALKSAADYERHRALRENLYVNRLHIPAALWKAAKVLEVGPSAGENALLLAQLGARLTLVEPVKMLCESLRALFSFYKQEAAIEKLISEPIENIEFDCKFDVVIAEGFINTLSNRSTIIRKLFNLLDKNGLLIISTSDSCGALVEYFKTALARVVTHSIAASEIEQRVKVVAQYFEEDFSRIAASRPFSSYARDMYFSPSVTKDADYPFDKIMRDLEECKPYYYSSYPSYAPINDMLWFKNVPSQKELFDRALSNYHFRSPSFVLAQNRSDGESCQALLAENSGKFSQYASQLVEILFQAGSSGSFAEFIKVADEIVKSTNGDLAQLFKEMQLVARNPSVEVYKASSLLRRTWGAPAHYVVFRKGSNF